MSDDFDLSAFLRKKMADERLTQTELATELGISQPSLSQILNGGQPRRATYEAIVRRYPELIGLAIFRQGIAP